MSICVLSCPSLEDDCDDVAEYEDNEGEGGQQVSSRHHRRSHSPGHQPGQPRLEDDQRDAAVRQQQVGRALQHSKVSTLQSAVVLYYIC